MFSPDFEDYQPRSIWSLLAEP